MLPMPSCARSCWHAFASVVVSDARLSFVHGVLLHMPLAQLSSGDTSDEFLPAATATCSTPSTFRHEAFGSAAAPAMAVSQELDRLCARRGRQLPCRRT